MPSLRSVSREALKSGTHGFHAVPVLQPHANSVPGLCTCPAEHAADLQRQHVPLVAVVLGDYTVTRGWALRQHM